MESNIMIGTRAQVALELLKILITLPGKYTEEELALISLSIADHFFENTSKPPATIRSRLEYIERSKKTN